MPPADAAEITRLIAALHTNVQRLEELTAGEVDTVADQDGRPFLLRRAQEHLRHSVADGQAALLNALPANIALLDAQGVIVAVNGAWRRFADQNELRHSGHGIGLNYLEVCDRACGDDATEAPPVADGIRSVLNGRTARFSMEYPCHSPTEQRWFLLSVTPLAPGQQNGAVVMHVAVTAERRAEAELRASELRFRQMADSINDLFFLREPGMAGRMLYISPAYEEIYGRSRESLYANQKSWFETIHLDDRASVRQILTDTSPTECFSMEFRVVRPDGVVRWVSSRCFPVLGATGQVERIAGVVTDITERVEGERELRESERRLSDMLETVQLASVVLDQEGRFTYCNEFLLRLIGRERAELIGHKWFHFVVPYADAGGQEMAAMTLESLPENWVRETEIVTSTGQRRLMLWHSSLRRSDDGQVIGASSIGADITEQRRVENRVKRLNRVYAVQSETNKLIVGLPERDELFTEACRIAVDVGALKRAWIGVIDPQTLDGAIVAECGREPSQMNRVKLTGRDGTPDSGWPASRAVRQSQPVVCNDIATEPTLAPLRDVLLENGFRSLASFPLVVAGRPAAVLTLLSGDTGFFDDEEMRLLLELSGNISLALDHIEKRNRLNYLAYYDVLTGLANRSLFVERVAQYMRSATAGGHRLAVYLVDLARFKNINDSLGQMAGDALLKQVADWLARIAGDVNLLARVGGDQFAMVLPEIKQADNIVWLLETTMAALHQHRFQITGSEFRMLCKVGAAIFPDDGGDADALLKNAEAALKKAKTGGERYLFYTKKMTDLVAGKFTMENQLRRALDRSEFVLHYQPKVSLATGRVTGAEALIRWNDPATGLVPPGRFIPVLEETGLIQEVGGWALRKAVADFLRWRRRGLAAVPIAVNVSPLQLHHRGFIHEIEKIVGIAPDAAAGLELEITEGVIMQDVQHNIATLQAIVGMGVGIAIDDFGTGFSSLGYLSKLPVQTLKIDRSFVIDMTTGPAGLALVSTIVNLGRALKLKVVAEGVETDEQAGLLRQLNCDTMQGYLFSKPVPLETFEANFLAVPPPSSAG